MSSVTTPSTMSWLAGRTCSTTFWGSRHEPAAAPREDRDRAALVPAWPGPRCGDDRRRLRGARGVLARPAGRRVFAVREGARPSSADGAADRALVRPGVVREALPHTQAPAAVGRAGGNAESGGAREARPGSPPRPRPGVLPPPAPHADPPAGHSAAPARTGG